MSSLYWKVTELKVCSMDLIFFVRLTSKLRGVFYAFLSPNWRVPEPLPVRSSLLHMATGPTAPLFSCHLLTAWVKHVPIVHFFAVRCWTGCLPQPSVEVLLIRRNAFLALYHWTWWCFLEVPVLQQLSYHLEGAKQTWWATQSRDQSRRWGGPVLSRLELPCSGLGIMLVINLPNCLSQCSQDFLLLVVKNSLVPVFLNWSIVDLLY